MECEKCKRGIMDGVALYKTNQETENPTWECWNCMDLIRQNEYKQTDAEKRKENKQ